MKMTPAQHHEICLGVLALCHAHAPPNLKLAIQEAVEAAEQMGLPVSADRLANGTGIATVPPGEGAEMFKRIHRQSRMLPFCSAWTVDCNIRLETNREGGNIWRPLASFEEPQIKFAIEACDKFADGKLPAHSGSKFRVVRLLAENVYQDKNRF